MLKVTKDCILQGVSVHKGETFCESDFSPADVQVIVGAGYAEFIDDVTEEDDVIAEEPEDFAIEPVKTGRKPRRKRKPPKRNKALP